MLMTRNITLHDLLLYEAIEEKKWIKIFEKSRKKQKKSEKISDILKKRTKSAIKHVSTEKNDEEKEEIGNKE